MNRTLWKIHGRLKEFEAELVLAIVISDLAIFFLELSRTLITLMEKCFWLRHKTLTLFLSLTFYPGFPGLLMLHWLDEDME